MLPTFLRRKVYPAPEPQRELNTMGHFEMHDNYRVHAICDNCHYRITPGRVNYGENHWYHNDSREIIKRWPEYRGAGQNALCPHTYSLPYDFISYNGNSNVNRKYAKPHQLTLDAIARLRHAPDHGWDYRQKIVIGDLEICTCKCGFQGSAMYVQLHLNGEDDIRGFTGSTKVKQWPKHLSVNINYAYELT